MNTTTMLVFACMTFIGITTPGPTVLVAMSNGSRYGICGALPGGLGAILADCALFAAVVLGLGALLAASEMPTVHAVRTVRAGMLFLRSFVVAISNPKVYLFFTAFVPLFISSSQSLFPQYMTMVSIVVGLNLLVMLCYATIGVYGVRLLKHKGPSGWTGSVGRHG